MLKFFLLPVDDPREKVKTSFFQLEGEEFELQRLIEERLKAEFGENEEEDEEDMNSLSKSNEKLFHYRLL